MMVFVIVGDACTLGDLFDDDYIGSKNEM